MTLPSWPSTLPQSFLINGLEEGKPKTSVRTNMDVGPAKVRRRFTATSYPIKATTELTTSQTLILDAFFDTTLVGGSQPFTFTHPRTGLAVTMRFNTDDGYGYRPAQDDPSAWTVVLSLEILPS